MLNYFPQWASRLPSHWKWVRDPVVSICIMIFYVSWELFLLLFWGRNFRKFNFWNLWHASKTMDRVKSTTLKFIYWKQRGFKSNNLNFHPRENRSKKRKLDWSEQKKKKSVKTRPEISKIENRKTTDKDTKSKAGSLKRSIRLTHLSPERENTSGQYQGWKKCHSQPHGS